MLRSAHFANINKMKAIGSLLVVLLVHLSILASALSPGGGGKIASLVGTPPSSKSLERWISDSADERNFLVLRGGDIELPSDEDDDGFVITKIRNVIRGVLQFGDKKLPVGSKMLRSCVLSIEKITGIRLLPVPPKKSKKKSGKKKSKKPKKKDVEDDNNEKKEDLTTIKDKSEEEGSESGKSKKKALKKPSATTKKHLSSSIKSTNPNYRVQRELKEFIKSPPPNLSVQVGSNMRVWVITMVGADNTIYEGEVFKLRVSFPPQYPTVPPSVYFVQGYVPVHEHVYTNGDICLSLLGKDWRPTMTAQSIAVSILSILSSAQSKSLPMDNAHHAGAKPGEYQKDWVYHDDNC